MATIKSVYKYLSLNMWGLNSHWHVHLDAIVFFFYFPILEYHLVLVYPDVWYHLANIWMINIISTLHLVVCHSVNRATDTNINSRMLSWKNIKLNIQCYMAFQLKFNNLFTQRNQNGILNGFYSNKNSFCLWQMVIHTCNFFAYWLNINVTHSFMAPVLWRNNSPLGVEAKCSKSSNKFSSQATLKQVKDQVWTLLHSTEKKIFQLNITDKWNLWSTHWLQSNQ